MLQSVLRYLLRVTSPGRTRLEWWDLIEIALVAFGFLLYFLVRGAVVDRTGEALSNARAIIDWQAAVGLWVEPQIQGRVLQSDLLVRAVNLVYFWLDFPLIVTVGLVLFWRKRGCYTLLRDALLISGGIALILYWAFPVAPPRYLTEWGFVDTLQERANLSYQAQSLSPFVNPFAAVPSLHVGWAALLAVVVFMATGSLTARVAAAASFAAQWFAVVATANHYLFDGVAGLLVAAIALAIALALQWRGYAGMHGLVARAERAVATPVEGEWPAPGG